MTRELLTDLTRKTALELGYSFCQGFDYRAQESIRTFPCLWLCPPKAISIKGRGRGKVTYRTVIHLMKAPARASQQTKEQAWCTLHEDAIKFYHSLGASPQVSSVSMGECTPAEFSLTAHGEISVTLKLDIEIPFCNNC